MKKFTLLIFMMLSMVGAKASQTVVYKNSFSTGNYASSFTLDKDLFANIAEGDVIWVAATADEEGATAASETWYQMNVKIAGGDWTSLASYYNMSPLGHWIHTVTADEATLIQTYGLYFEGHFVTIQEVAYGDAFATTAVQHWDSSTNAWSTEGFTISTNSDTWASQTLNTSGQLSSARIGDRITVNYTTGASGEWDARVVLYDATDDNNWTTIYDFPAGTSTTVTFLVTDDNYSMITSGDIRLGGCNYAVTSINLETSDFTYNLSAYNDHVGVAYLPTSYPINILLTRKFDWNTSICVPFDIASVTETFGSTAKAYEFKEYNSGLVFTERSSIDAGVPYYMTLGEEDKDQTSITLSNVEISTTLNNSATSNNLTFKGNYTPNMDMEGHFGVACVQIDGNWVWGFYKGGSGSTLNAFSAYIDGTAGSRLSVVFEESGTTGIADGRWKMEEGRVVYYDLQGRQVTEPVKGLYIGNGKKVIVK